MFTSQGIMALENARPRRLLAAGMLSGVALALIPAVFLVGNALINVVGQLRRGQSLLHADGSFLYNLKTMVAYVLACAPYLVAVCAICAIQTLLCIKAIRKRKTFEVSTGGLFNTDTFWVGWDAVFFAAAFPVLVPFFSSRAAILLLWTGPFYLMAGATLYIMWARVFEYLMRRLSVLSTLDLVRLALQEVMVGHDWLYNCSIEATVSADGTTAKLTGRVLTKDQLATASFAATKVWGIVHVDTSEMVVSRLHRAGDAHASTGSDSGHMGS